MLTYEIACVYLCVCMIFIEKKFMCVSGCVCVCVNVYPWMCMCDACVYPYMCVSVYMIHVCLMCMCACVCVYPYMCVSVFDVCVPGVFLCVCTCVCLARAFQKCLRIECDMNQVLAEMNQCKGPLKVMISGAPASGKGTQCELIVKHVSLHPCIANVISLSLFL